MTVEKFEKTLRQINDSTIYYQREWISAGGVGISGLLANSKTSMKFNNGIQQLECTDVSGKKVIVPVRRSTMATLFGKPGKKTISYIFDTMFLLNDSIIVGRYDKGSDLLIRFRPYEISKIEIGFGKGR